MQPPACLGLTPVARDVPKRIIAGKSPWTFAEVPEAATDELRSNSLGGLVRNEDQKHPELREKGVEP